MPYLQKCSLRLAICDWYKRRFNVDLDPETEAIATIGANPAQIGLFGLDVANANVATVR